MVELHLHSLLSLFFNKYVVLLRDFWGLSAGMVNVAVVLSPQASLGLDSSLAQWRRTDENLGMAQLD